MQLIETKYQSTINDFEDLKYKYTQLCDMLIHTVQTEEMFRKDPNLNEAAHGEIYNIKKIISMFDTMIEHTNNLDEDKYDVFLELFNDSVMQRNKTLYKESKKLLEVLIKTKPTS